MHRCVTQTSGDAILVQDSQTIALFGGCTLSHYSHGPQRGWVTTMTHAQMCDTDLSRCYCGAGFPEHCLVWCHGCTLLLAQVRHSHDCQRGWVTTMTHAQMCDTDLRRSYCGAGFPEHSLVWSQGCTLSLSQV